MSAIAGNALLLYLAAPRFAYRKSKLENRTGCDRRYCPRNIDRKVLFGIKSSAKIESIARRNIIRQSFVQQIKEFPQATYTFVLSRPDHPDAAAIQSEAETKRDITFLNHLSENKRVGSTVKTVEWFKRVTQQPPVTKYDWVCNVDDDSYVQVSTKIGIKHVYLITLADT